MIGIALLVAELPATVLGRAGYVGSIGLRCHMRNGTVIFYSRKLEVRLVSAEVARSEREHITAGRDGEFCIQV